MITIYLKNTRFSGMSIFPFMFIKNTKKGNESLIRHEKIHQKQQLEMTVLCLLITIGIDLSVEISNYYYLIFPFIYYVLYFLEWVIRGIYYNDFKLLSKSYRMISFEQEAYRNQIFVNYKRPLFAWTKYLFNW